MPTRASVFRRDTKAVQRAFEQAFTPDLKPTAQGAALDELIEVAKRLRWRLVQVAPGTEPVRGRPASARRHPSLRHFSLLLPGKTTTALLEAGITTREQLLLLSIEELHAIPNLGKVGVSSIRRGLLDAGIRLRLYPRGT